jgi:hypothetical protein
MGSVGCAARQRVDVLGTGDGAAVWSRHRALENLAFRDNGILFAPGDCRDHLQRGPPAKGGVEPALRHAAGFGSVGAGRTGVVARRNGDRVTSRLDGQITLHE